ncbi:MAG: RHS repeat-associated core domain-containing protein [Streptosporangiaceae bacterium]
MRLVRRLGMPGRRAGAARRAVAGGLVPVLAAAGFVAAGTVAATAGTVVAAGPAQASSVSVLILSTSVNGGLSSAEAQAVAAVSPGATVTVDTPSQWDALSKANFASYSAIILGDPSSGGSCSPSAPSDALSTESAWGPAVTGNVAVLGTAPALAGSAGTALMDDAVKWALAGSGTGMYVSLNCDYAGSSVTNADAALLDGVGGGGFDVTGQNSQGPSCTDSGTVNTWEADSTASFAGLDSSSLSASSWAPACPVQETFDSWPATFTPVAYDAAASPAQFTASDGQTGQPYVLAGTPAPSAAVQAIAPSQGGAVLAGTTSGGGSNPAAGGVSQAAAGGGATSAASSPSSSGSGSGPVNTENGDFTQSSTDLSIPTFGPGLDFTRTYDGQVAEQQTRSATPGPLGYGWTDNWATSLSAGNPVPGDIYSLDGLATDTGNGSGATQGPLDYPDTAVFRGGDVYIVDTAGNRVEEVPGSSGSQWGISMTAGDMYTIAGSVAGAYGDSPNGTANEAPGGGSLLDRPGGLAFDSAGNLYIADSANNRVLEIPVASGTQRGVAMTADDVYTVAGNWGGSQGHSGDGGAATAAFLNDPVGLAIVNGGSDLYIADAGNNRVQEVAGEYGAQWGITPAFTANDIYTIAGSPTGTAGATGDGGAATAALLGSPEGVSLSSSGDLYVADTGNNRVQEIPVSSGAQWGITPAFSADDIYTVAGSATGNSGTSGDGGKATVALLAAPASVVCDNGTQLYVADSGSNRVQEVARTTHSEWGVSMTAGDVYTIAGSAAGARGSSGDGGPATSALLDDPGQVALDGTADLWIADTGNNRVREVQSATGDISSFAGDGETLASIGDKGPAVDGELFRPAGEAEDAQGNIYIADAGNNRIQEIPATSHAQWGFAMTAGDVYTIAGSRYGLAGIAGDGGPVAGSRLDYPYGIAVDAAGDLFIADQGNNRVQEVSAATGNITTIAGSATGAAGYTPAGPATSALLDAPDGVAVDAAGDVYIADSGNNRVEEVYASGGKSWGQAMTAGDMYTIAGSASAASGLSGDGGAAASALLWSPQSLAFSPAGDLYIGDTRNCRVQEIPAATAGGMTKNDIYTIAGSPGGTCGPSGDGGPAVDALLSKPAGMAADASGDLYIADGNNDRVQEIPAANGTQWGQSMTAGDMYTVAGNATKGESGDGGPATAAEMSFAVGVSVDSTGNLYIADWAGNHLREVTASAQATITAAPGLTSSLYPPPGATTGGTTYPGGITVTQPGGARVTFYTKPSGSCATGYTTDASGTYCIQPQDEGASLTWNSGSSTWSFTADPGDTTYTYTYGGFLASEADTAGDTLTAAYSTPTPGSGNCPSTASSCETITAANGRTLVIGSDATFQVTSVTDPLGREWTYGYNTAGDLTSATDPMGNKTTYTYGQGSTGNPLLASDLVTIAGPNAQPGGPDAGDDTAMTYSAAGQVSSQTDPLGQKTTFSYCASTTDGDCMNTATGNGIVTATDAGGNTTVYQYDEGTLAAQSDWTNGTTLAGETDNLPDTTAGTLKDTSTFDGNGNQTIYQDPDADGNPTKTTAPDGTGQETAIYQTYTSALQDTSCSTDAEATTGSCTGPAPVAPSGVIIPPSSAPPLGVTDNLFDRDGNELYTTTGVYQPGASSASYQQTTYQLFNGNSVTLPGTSNAVSCTATAPSQSLPCARIDADGVVAQLAYDAAGDLTSSSTPDGNGSEIAQTTYGYDGDGEQTSTTLPDGNVIHADAGNYSTVATYNADGGQKTVTQAGGSGATVTPRTTTFGYDADGNQTSVEDARGYTATTAYNADDEPVLATDPEGNAALTCYDADGNVAQTVPPRGVSGSGLSASSCPVSYPAGYSDRLSWASTVDTYDAAGNVAAETTPAPAGQSGYETTAYAYDGDGNLIKTNAPPASNGGSDQVTVNTYNSDDEITSETTGHGTSALSTTSYCYDPDGNQTSAVMPDGNISGTAACETSSPWVVSSTAHPTQAGYQTTSSYDSADELVSTTSPATAAAPSGATTTYTYDPAGNQLTFTDPDGVTTTSTYTPTGQPATQSYSGSSAHSVSYGYDADGNQTSMTDATGSSSYGYDPFRELTSATNGASQTVGYGYNADGDNTSVTYPLPAAATWATSATVTYGYNNADVLKSATDFNGHEISITNNADSLPDAAVLGSTGDTIDTTYDDTDAPSAISLKNSTATLQSFSYADAPSGDVLTETDTPSSSHSPATYTYDAQGRLSSMTPGSGSVLSYGFDASGNLTTLPTGATTTYDKASELTSSALSGTTTAYAYNANGDQLSSSQGGTTTSSATWNGATRLTAYSATSADMTAATYDGNGLRASSATTPFGGSAVSQQYVWNSSPDVPELLMDSASAYIYTTGNAPAEQVNLSTGTITYLFADSLGSVRGTVSSSGALTGTTSYDAWGNPQTAGGLTATTPFGFVGGYTDPDGLIYLINRYYNPATGQFISVDPDLVQTQAAYAYAGANPVANTDPAGLKWESGHCSEQATPGGWRVHVCLSTICTTLCGKWYSRVGFHARSGQIEEVGARDIGMDVCGEGRKPNRDCKHNKGEVKNPRAYGRNAKLQSKSDISGVPWGWNWLYAWVNNVWAELTNGQKTNKRSLRDKWVKTCQSYCIG